MDYIKVEMAVPRSGPKVNDAIGDKVEVGMHEAKRMLLAGHIAEPTARDKKAIMAVELPEEREDRERAEQGARERAEANDAEREKAEEIAGVTVTVLAEQRAHEMLAERRDSDIDLLNAQIGEAEIVAGKVELERDEALKRVTELEQLLADAATTLKTAKAEVKSLSDKNATLVQELAELQKAPVSDAGKPLSKG
jgi:chromosome segregation ATPase